MCRDTNQFLELLKPEYNDAVNYCHALCAGWSPDDAEDVLQQALLNGLEGFDSLNDSGKFRSWFFKIITRTFYSSVRRHFWKKFIPMDKIQTDIPEIYPRNELNEDRLIISSALSRLSSKERTAILLYEIAGFSIEEIKQMQNENSNSAVKSRLSRARKKLRRYIEEPENADAAGSRKKQSRIPLNGSEYSGGDIENETIKLAAQLRTRK
jgi:RNA polymerase sigma-70 factor (ECF subfamily)